MFFHRPFVFIHLLEMYQSDVEPYAKNIPLVAPKVNRHYSLLATQTKKLLIFSTNEYENSTQIFFAV